MGSAMHKVFGIKDNKAYLDRKGAYLVPIRGEKVGVVETAKGYFLLGGGIEGEETDNQCIIRECIEETGYQVEIKEKVSMRNAERGTNHFSIQARQIAQCLFLHLSHLF